MPLPDHPSLTQTASVVRRWIVPALFALYLGGVAYATFGPDPGTKVDRVARSVEGVGERARDAVGSGRRPAAPASEDGWAGFSDAEDAGNVVMFVPFGVLFPLVFPRRRRLTLPAGSALSGTIELVQLTLLTHRSPQWNDIWWNGWGVVAGFGVFSAVRWIRSRER